MSKSHASIHYLLSHLSSLSLSLFLSLSLAVSYTCISDTKNNHLVGYSYDVMWCHVTMGLHAWVDHPRDEYLTSSPDLMNIIKLGWDIFLCGRFWEKPTSALPVNINWVCTCIAVSCVYMYVCVCLSVDLWPADRPWLNKPPPIINTVITLWWSAVPALIHGEEWYPP